MIGFTMIGASQMTSNFSLEFFLIEGQPITEFMKLNAVHFEDGFRFDMYHKLDTVDVTSEEVQI